VIYSDRMRVFLHAMDGPDTPEGDGTPDFGQMRIDAENSDIPIIRKEMESFLRVLLELAAPRTILEVGTAVGYSAQWMACCRQEADITTIENYPPRLEAARINIAASPYRERITLIEGDAAQVLAHLTGQYDFIFMDAAKAQYLHFLPDALKLLRTGGVLVSDNVLQDGVILESHYAVERRDRTIYRRMREYLRVLKQTDGLVTSIVPVGDGAAVTIKDKDNISIRTDMK